jgi:AraC-like DNA-binding protein
MGVFFEKIELAASQSFRLLKWTDNVRQVELCLGNGRTENIPGAGEQWHFHSEMELTLITAGSGVRFVGDHIESFQAPDLVLIGANLPHYWSDLHNSSGYAIQLSVGKNDPLWRLQEVTEIRELCKLAARGIHYNKTFAESIVDKFILMEQVNQAKQLSIFIDIMDDLCCWETERTFLSKKDFSISVTARHLGGISDAILYLSNRFEQHVEFDELLEITHMSKSTFCRQFKHHTGKTYSEFLNEVRIDNSCRLLAETCEPVTSIAYQSGFRNLSHFNRKFLEYCNVTPKAYRDKFTKTSLPNEN